jgi:N-methylhydantoinase B/oxoprolinase/acetone carboxylase alpha subunit
VISDVKNGYITLEQAETDYGVILDDELNFVEASAARIQAQAEHNTV